MAGEAAPAVENLWKGRRQLGGGRWRRMQLPAATLLLIHEAALPPLDRDLA